MEARSLEYIRAAVSGQLIGSGETMINGISTDSRTVRPGDCFVALAGDKFDGHDFLSDVAAKGALAAVIDCNRIPKSELNCALVTVANTRRALGHLAAYYRSEFKLPAIGVAGSNGKTTTKEILAALLRQKFSALWSEASFNNDIGVPLTLLKLESHHQVAIFELGTNHPGELRPLIQMVQPEIGVITSIGREHLEFFGDLAAVAEEQGTLAELIPASGSLVINGDSEWTPEITKRCKGEVVRVWQKGPRHPGPQQSEGATGDWWLKSAKVEETGVHFQVKAPAPEFSGEYFMPLLGTHQALNATLAIVVAEKLGLAAEQIRRGLCEVKPAKMRLQIWEADGVRVLDDSYNANADSMIAALQTLHDLPTDGRRVAMLGDMAELGEHTKAAHVEVGKKAAELKIDQLFTVGFWATHTAEAARSKGMKNVCACPDIQTAIAELENFLGPGDLLLLKASRVAGLERVSAALRKTQ